MNLLTNQNAFNVLICLRKIKLDKDLQLVLPYLERLLKTQEGRQILKEQISFEHINHLIERLIEAKDWQHARKLSQQIDYHSAIYFTEQINEAQAQHESMIDLIQQTIKEPNSDNQMIFKENLIRRATGS